MIWLSRSLLLGYVGLPSPLLVAHRRETAIVPRFVQLFFHETIAAKELQLSKVQWLAISVTELLTYALFRWVANFLSISQNSLSLTNLVGVISLLLSVFRTWVYSANPEVENDPMPFSQQAQTNRDQTYRMFIEQSGEGIWCIELDKPLLINGAETEQIEHFYRYGYIADCNQAFARMHGYSTPQAVIGNRLKDFLTRSSLYDVEFFQAFIRSRYRLVDQELQGVNLSFLDPYSKTHLRPQMSSFLCSLTSKIENGATHSAWGMQHDITELKQRLVTQQSGAQSEQPLNIDLEHQVQKRTAQLQQASEFEITLKRITDKVRDSLDEAQILQTAVQELGMGMGVNSCNAAIYDVEAGTSTIAYEYNPSIVSFKGSVAQMAESPELYSQLLAGQYFQFCSVYPSPVRGRVAILACPIVDDQKVLGDLWLITERDYGFRDLELRLVQQVANQCAIALRQARLYQAAQQQVEQLEKLNQLKDDFLSTVSHELRTPVSNMKLSIHMLEIALQKPGETIALPVKATRYLQILRDECEREINLINDLLDLQRLEAGVHASTAEPIHLQTWLPELVGRFQERARDHQQTLQIQLNPTLSTLVSDPISLERVLTELLNNACKYTPSGETITVTGCLRPAGGVQLQVINTGVEIPANERLHIFDKFYRIVGGDPWKQGGTGLGLTLVQKLMEHLSGSIAIESADGQTAFTLQVPNLSLSESDDCNR